MDANNHWPRLEKPPVVMAIMQLKFDQDAISLDDFAKYDTALKRLYPNRRDNIQVGLDFGDVNIPLGKSTITSQSDAKLRARVYFSNDQKIKFELSEGTVSFTDERKYTSWDNFQEQAIRSLSVISDLLCNIEIKRTSIRFINSFTFKEFENPEDYFNTVISYKEGKALPFPLRRYSFRMTMDVPDTDMYTILNQGVDLVKPDEYSYTLDIDVLDKQRIFFAKDSLLEILSRLREIKNTIFFKTLTDKTIALCN